MAVTLLLLLLLRLLLHRPLAHQRRPQPRQPRLQRRLPLAGLLLCFALSWLKHALHRTEPQRLQRQQRHRRRAPRPGMYDLLRKWKRRRLQYLPSEPPLRQSHNLWMVRHQQ